MRTHYLHIGQTIYDISNERWGEVLRINDKAKCTEVTDGNEIVVYMPFDSQIECETISQNAYPLNTSRKTINGIELCDEINADTFDSEHQYRFYSPYTNENYFESETILAYD